ncbi:hypothetical protein BpHYR1_017392 [Brachionus plicatilis]|uniref:Uncharacterized protein n=1 Tax=Brachionus plicatilis TaxID=10195 RepID=A0A3M7QFY1_BRAPC|nr:hypothetical protein BpHYR1_017392 [Brachionus plicatilis]
MTICFKRTFDLFKSVAQLNKRINTKEQRSVSSATFTSFDSSFSASGQGLAFVQNVEARSLSDAECDHVQGSDI